MRPMIRLDTIRALLEHEHRRRTTGPVVMIAWDGLAGPESEAARQHTIEFAQAPMPVLRQHLPS